MNTPLADLEDLICPTCDAQVCAEPPSDDTEAEWSHLDGSPLCAGSEPIERLGE